MLEELPHGVLNLRGIFIFLGWQFVAAEIVGGIVMITISTVLIRLTYGWTPPGSASLPQWLIVVENALVAPMAGGSLHRRRHVREHGEHRAHPPYELRGPLGITPESERVVEEVMRFGIDYTFWLNLAMVFLAGGSSGSIGGTSPPGTGTEGWRWKAVGSSSAPRLG